LQEGEKYQNLRLYVKCPMNKRCKILLQYANFHLDFAELSNDKINLYSVWLEPLDKIDNFDKEQSSSDSFGRFNRYQIAATNKTIFSSSNMISNFENCFANDQNCLTKSCNYFDPFYRKKSSLCNCSSIPSKWKLAVYRKGMDINIK